MKAREVYRHIARDYYGYNQYEVDGLSITVRLSGDGRDYFIWMTADRKIGLRWSEYWRSPHESRRGDTRYAVAGGAVYTVKWIKGMEPTEADIVKLRLILP